MADALSANLRHLEGLVLLLASGSVSAAAAGVNLTQSALTQAISRLERDTGCRLFERSSRGTLPTISGDLLGRSAAKALDLLNEALQECGEDGASRATTRHVTLTQLRALAAVEAVGGHRAAARTLGISQPSVHRSVGDLERRLGVPLFVRSATGLRANRAATVLARATRLALRELRSGLEAARSTDLATERLRIGAMATVRAGLLPAAMAELCAKDLRVRLQVVEGSYRELLDALLDGEIDMMLGTLLEEAPPGAIQHRLFDDDAVIVSRSDHPLARHAEWPAEALLAYPWVISPAGTPRRVKWENVLRSQGLAPPSPRIECSSAGAIRGLLLQGEWLTMLSPDQFRIEQELGLLVALSSPPPADARAIGVTMRQGASPSTVEQSLLDILLRSAHERSQTVRASKVR